MLKFYSVLAFALLSTAARASDVIAIGCGSAAANGTFVADTDFSGGSVYTNNLSINTANVLSPAPQAVYDNTRYGNFSYTIPGLTPGGSYLVRLHFAEIYWSASGARAFNVSINNKQVLSNFDIFAAAGGRAIANIQQFAVPADGAGNITIQFTNVVDNAQCNGIEVALISPPPAPNYNLTLSSDKLTYSAGNTATVLASLSRAPADPDFDFFVSAQFNGSPIGLSPISKGESYAITPALASGVGLFSAVVYLENRKQTEAFNATINFYTSDIANLMAQLDVTNDPNAQATLRAKIAHDQDRLAATQVALSNSRTQVGVPANLNIYTF